MKIVVTGGAGYVGSTLIPQLLAEGHEVTVLDSFLFGGEGLLGVWAHPKFKCVAGDVRDAAVVQRTLRGVDAVVHLAAIVGDPACAKQKELTRAVNLDAAFRIYDDCLSAGVQRFVFASTCSNYGRMEDPSSYVTETSELKPVSLYAETKVAAEKYYLEKAKAASMTTTVLRSATVFGIAPRMRFDLTVNEFTMEAVTKKHVTIYGGQFWRPYIHVKELGRAICVVLAADKAKVHGEVFNVGSTEANFQKDTLAKMIQKTVPDCKVEHVSKLEDPRDYRVSFEKIKRELGFVPKPTVEEGISEIAQVVASRMIPDPTSMKYRNS